MAESALDADEDDPFEEQRENADNPMGRLFSEYGRPNALQVTVGILASIFARLLDRTCDQVLSESRSTVRFANPDIGHLEPVRPVEFVGRRRETRFHEPGEGRIDRREGCRQRLRHAPEYCSVDSGAAAYHL